MKHIAYSLAIAAMVFAGCSNLNVDQQEPAQKNNVTRYSASGSIDQIENGTKTSLGTAVGGVYPITWTDGDAIKVIPAGGSPADFAMADYDGTTSAFEGELSEADTKKSPFYGVYPTTAFNEMSGSNIVATVPTSQAATAGTFAPGANVQVSKDDNGFTGTLDYKFKNCCALVKITIPGTLSITSLKVGNDSKGIAGSDVYMAGKTTFSADGSIVSRTNDDANMEVALTGTIESGKTYFVAILPGTYKNFYIEFQISGRTTVNRRFKESATFTRNKMYNMDGVITALFDETEATTGYIPISLGTGEFSVDASSKVKFATGNLTYKCETKQCILHNDQRAALLDGASNTVADPKSGTIDLFSWPTSTHSPIVCALDVAPGFKGAWVEYGTSNFIYDYNKSRGVKNYWYTLSEAEWTYLLETRAAGTVNGVANARFIKATIVDKYGVLLFPDANIAWPSGCTTTNIDASTINNIRMAVTAGPVFTEAEWQALEEAGCVFIPSGGLRSAGSGAAVLETARCFYWTSTSGGDTEVSGRYTSRYLEFHEQDQTYDVYFRDGWNVDGRSVRLVHKI